MQIAFTVSEDECYKGLPSMNIILRACRFFFSSSSSFHFHRTLFCGLAGAYVNPGRFSLFVHSLVYPITHSFLDGFQPNLVQHFPHVCSTCHTVSPITHSFLDGFQPNLVQHFPHVCSTCHTVFSLKNTLEYFFERLLHCRLIFSITWIPDK